MDADMLEQKTVSDTEQGRRIRTFAGDMKVMKDGRKPDLIPLEVPRPPVEISEKKVALMPPIPNQSDPIQKPIFSVSTPVSVMPPVPEIQKPTFIETYAGDFSQKIKEEHASVATVLAAEQDAWNQLPGGSIAPPQNSSDNKNYLYAAVGVFLLVASVVGIYTTYSHFVATISETVIVPTISAPIAVEEREQITSTNSSDLLLAVKQSLTRPVAGNVRFLYLENTTKSDIFSELKLSAPDALLRNTDVAGGMVGIMNISGNQSPFFILSVVSYGNTFASMLSWEISMVRDLNPLFPTYQSVSVATTTVTEITATTTVRFAPPLSFRDEIVSNHDVRVYRDADGRSVLLYGYWNQATLIIARDPKAFSEITQRLANATRQ